jgi:hypothetical protein
LKAGFVHCYNTRHGVYHHRKDSSPPGRTSVYPPWASLINVRARFTRRLARRRVSPSKTKWIYICGWKRPSIYTYILGDIGSTPHTCEPNKQYQWNNVTCWCQLNPSWFVYAARDIMILKSNPAHYDILFALHCERNITWYRLLNCPAIYDIKMFHGALWYWNVSWCIMTLKCFTAHGPTQKKQLYPAPRVLFPSVAAGFRINIAGVATNKSLISERFEHNVPYMRIAW